MKHRKNLQISLFHCFAGTALFSLALSQLLNVGPLSTLVGAVALIAIAVVLMRVSQGWAALSGLRKSIAIAVVIVWATVVLYFSSIIWMHADIRSDRLTTIYRNRLNAPQLHISMFRDASLLVTVKANLSSEKILNALRDDLLEQFRGESNLHFYWDVQILNGPAIVGADREWFFQSSDSDQETD